MGTIECVQARQRRALLGWTQSSVEESTAVLGTERTSRGSETTPPPLALAYAAREAALTCSRPTCVGNFHLNS